MDKENLTMQPVEAHEAQLCLSCDSGCCLGTCHCRSNLDSYNWLEDVPGNTSDTDLVEVHFKNTRRGFFHNVSHLPLKKGDVVAVEAIPGHDIGTVAMTGRLVKLQMKKANLKPGTEILRIFRLAKPADIERFEIAKAKEADTMIRSRKIAADLGLKMKIGDVEYQGDGNKAIFYYIADGRVDFRQLIKVLAETFRIRVEMKQIGARQEAGRIGGIGPCGRPLCCASWMNGFISVGTSAARFQDVSLNPQKLAGQCAKLKCCLNFEVDTYVEAVKQLPPKDVHLFTTDSTYYYFKADIFTKQVTYSTDRRVAANLVTIDSARAFEIIEMNKRGEKPEQLKPDGYIEPVVKSAYGDLVGQDSISRFDNAKKKKRKKKTTEQRQNADSNGKNPIAKGNAQGHGKRDNEQQPKQQQRTRNQQREQQAMRQQQANADRGQKQQWRDKRDNRRNMRQKKVNNGQ